MVSRRKQKSAAQPPPSERLDSPPLPGTGWGLRGRKWVIAAGVVALAGAIYYWCQESPQTCYARARTMLTRDPRQCEQLAELAVIKAGGNYPAAQLLQCRALAATGQWDAAYGGLSLIKDTSSCDPSEMLELGLNALDAHQIDMGVMALNAARAFGPTRSRALELLVRLELQFQHTEKARELCQEWQEAYPDNPLPWIIGGDIAKSEFDFGAAIADYRAALKSSPRSELANQARTSLAQLLVLTGDPVAARDEFDILLKSGPLKGKMRLIYAQLLRMEGRLDQARAEVDQFISASGSNAEALKLRGMVRLDLGQLKDALSDLQQSVKENPYDGGTHHMLAQAYLRLGQIRAAQPHLDQGRKLTEATLRISDVRRLLQADPANGKLQKEMTELSKTLGRGIEP